MCVSYLDLVSYINEFYPDRMDIHFSIGGCWFASNNSKIFGLSLSWEEGIEYHHIEYSYIINTGGGSDLLLETYFNNMRGMVMRDKFYEWLVVRRNRVIDLVLLD